MARITVEDCLGAVDNRFQLVMLAAKRARDLSLSAIDPKVDWENDKATVVALREIAEGLIKPEYLFEEHPVVQEVKEEIKEVEKPVPTISTLNAPSIAAAKLFAERKQQAQKEQDDKDSDNDSNE